PAAPWPPTAATSHAPNTPAGTPRPTGNTTTSGPPAPRPPNPPSGPAAPNAPAPTATPTPATAPGRHHRHRPHRPHHRHPATAPTPPLPPPAPAPAHPPGPLPADIPHSAVNYHGRVDRQLAELLDSPPVWPAESCRFGAVRRGTCRARAQTKRRLIFSGSSVRRGPIAFHGLAGTSDRVGSASMVATSASTPSSNAVKSEVLTDLLMSVRI